MTLATAPSEVTPTRWLNRLLSSGGWCARAAMVLPLLSGTLLLAQAWLLASILHRAIVAGEAMPALTGSILILLAVITMRAAIGIGAETLAIRGGEAIKTRVRNMLVANLLGRAPSWTAARPSGALAGLVMEQVDSLESYFVRYLPAMVQAAILPLVFIAVAFSIDWVVGVLFLLTVPLIPVFMALAGWGAEAASKAQAGALSRLSGRFADRLRGLVTLKLFGRAEAETAAIHDASEELRRRTMGVMRIAFLSSAVLEFFAALGVAGVALYVGLTFLDLVSLRGSELTLEAGLFCLLMAPDVYQPMRLLAAHYHDRAAAKAAAAEIVTMVGALPLPRVLSDGLPSPARRSSAVALGLDGVSLTTPTGRPVMSSVSLVVPAGRHVAILGESGSGKSTLLETMAGLRDYGGSITLDASEITQMDQPDLRRIIAMLGQRPRVFAGTIAENIRLGRPAACDISVLMAARRACVDSFADHLPLGLDTPLGENGLGLSGGEVQRVALARIYLRNPALILLDEPTAHLDAATEAAVLDGLLDFAVTRTLIIATHSPAVAARMDEVWHATKGRLSRTARAVAGSRRIAEGVAA